LNRRHVIVATVVAFAVVVMVIVVMKRGADRGPRCNLLLITLDTTRADRLGCYGYDGALTPALDELAAGGVLFEQAFANVPLTLPSHTTLLTGLQPAEHGLRVNGANRLDSSIPTLAAELRQQGYDTGAFIAACALDSDFGLDRGFGTYDDEQTGAYGSYADDPFSQYRPGDLVTDAALAWLEERGEEPFFCWVHLYDPHLPYYVHEAMSETRFSGQKTYDAEVAFMDMQVRRLTAFLKKRDLTRRTVVVAVGDHGEGLGEHQEVGHGYMLYETTQRVPLIFSAPGRIREGDRGAAMVSLVDFFPTILDLLDIPGTYQGMGRSLRPALEGGEMDSIPCYGETDMPYTSFGWCPLRSVTTPRWKYIRTARVELYDRQADPGELNNLADIHPEQMEQLEAELSAIEGGMTLHVAEEVELAAEAKRRLEVLGYVAAPRHSIDTSSLDLSSLRDIKDVLPVAYAVITVRELVHQGEVGRALEMCREMIKLSPESSRVRFCVGNVLLECEQIEEAAAEFREALTADPDNLEARNNLGRALLTLGKTDEAVEQFTKAVQLDPDSAEVLANLGNALLKQRRIDEAIKHCREAVRLKPDLVEARKNLSEALLERGAVDEAIMHGTEAVRLAPDNDEAHGSLAMALAARGRLDEAIVHFAKVVELKPGLEVARENLALALARRGRLDEAVKQFGEVLRLNPENDQAHYNLGIVLFQKGQLDEATAHFREAVRLKPDNADAHTNLGNALLARGSVDEAIAHCARAVQLNPDLLAAHYNLGVALLYQERLDEAVKHFNEVLRLNPDHKQAREKLNAALAKRRSTSAAHADP